MNLLLIVVLIHFVHCHFNVHLFINGVLFEVHCLHIPSNIHSSATEVKRSRNVRDDTFS